MEAIKRTLAIEAQNKQGIDSLVSRKVYPSFTAAVNDAIAEMLRRQRKKEYEEMMAHAAKDKAFMERTMRAQAEFDAMESEVDAQW